MQDTVPWFRFSTPDVPNDPENMTEAVGDADAVKSTTLALRNLERVMDMMLEVAERPGEDYGLLEELYGQAVGQWGRYMRHVAALIGGALTQERYGTGRRFEPVPEARQRAAMAFLDEHAFRPPRPRGRSTASARPSRACSARCSRRGSSTRWSNTRRSRTATSTG
jgi:hypothetical protein